MILSASNPVRFLVLLSALMLSGCQSYGPRNFENLHVGMEKSAVVETAGSPTITRRWEGKDRWIYEYRDRTDKVVVKEIHFENGKSVYVGPPPPPTITASEQDKINQQAVEQGDEADRQENLRRDRLLGIQRAHGKGEAPEAEDAVDHKLRESLYGVDPDPQALRNTFAPVYTPIQ
jgi:hypothetical protein